MSATVTVKRRNMRSFDVNERHTRGDVAMAATSLGDYFEPATDFFFWRRNDGGRETGHAIGQHDVDKANHGIRGNLLRVQVEPGASVYLQIHESGREIEIGPGR